MSRANAPLLVALPYLTIVLLSGCTSPSGSSYPGESKPGVQTPRPLGSTESGLGYYEYLPASYASDPLRTYPLLVFLHGSGEAGDGMDDLPRVLRNGPPHLIQDDRWLDVTTAPFIVVSAQSASGFPAPDVVHDLIDDLASRYRVDVRRIYLTGLSAGAFATWAYIGAYRNQVAAVIPIAGGGNASLACSFKDVPIWAFHGDADGTVNVTGSIAQVTAVNACVPAPKEPARLTIYRGVGHDSWSRTYDLSGMNGAEVAADSQPYDRSIYDWLLEHHR